MYPIPSKISGLVQIFFNTVREQQQKYEYYSKPSCIKPLYVKHGMEL